METTPEYDQAIAGLKRGTLTGHQGGSAEENLGQAYRQMRQRDPRWPRLRTKYRDRTYKSTGTSKGGQGQPRTRRWFGKNAPHGAGTGN